MPLLESNRHSLLGCTFQHCQALVCPSLGTPRRLWSYSMTSHHHTFLNGFGCLLSRQTPFFAFRPFNYFAFVLFCHRIQPLQQRSTFLIVQRHRGFWLSAVQRKRAWPLLVHLSHSTNFNTFSVHTVKVTHFQCFFIRELFLIKERSSFRAMAFPSNGIWKSSLYS